MHIDAPVGSDSCRFSSRIRIANPDLRYFTPFFRITSGRDTEANSTALAGMSKKTRTSSLDVAVAPGGGAIQPTTFKICPFSSNPILSMWPYCGLDSPLLFEINLIAADFFHWQRGLR